MSKNRKLESLGSDINDVLVAEEELILEAQTLIQRALNDRKMSQKRLAEELGVSDSYVSQMLGTSARNLTLRTFARILNALGTKATITFDDEIRSSDRQLKPKS